MKTQSNAWYRRPPMILPLLGCLALASLPTHAVEEHHPEQTEKTVQATMPKTPAAPLEQMRRNVGKMQSQLDRIRRVKAPEERQKLLREHMQTLQQNMMLGRGMMPGETAASSGMMGGGMMGGGMMSGGMMAHHGMGMDMNFLATLDLTDEQWTKIGKLHDEFRKKRWELAGKEMVEEGKLRDLYAADRPDAAAIGEVYRKIFDLRRQLIEAMVDCRNRMEETLTTTAQKAKLKRMWRDGGMMDHGMMDHGMMGY